MHKKERERARKKRCDTEEKEEFKVREQEKKREKRVRWPSLRVKIGRNLEMDWKVAKQAVGNGGAGIMSVH